MRRRTHAAGAIAPGLIAALFAFGATASASGAPVRTLSQLQWNQDGTALVGLADEGGRNAAFQAYDGATGGPTWRLALERLRDPLRGRKLKLDRWQPSAVEGELLIESEGDLFLASSSGGPLRRLTSSKSPELDALLSPDGSRVAFQRDGDLWAIEIASGTELRLTSDGKPPAIVNSARPETGEAELFAGGSGFAWAPESRTIAYLRRSEDALRLHVVSVLTEDSFELETGVPGAGSLTEVHWRFDARALGVERRSADGSRLELLLCHPEKLYCRQLAKRPLPAGEGARRDFRFLGGGFVWGSSAGTAGDLSFYDTLGRERRPLALGSWESRRLEAVDEATDTVLISTSRPTADRGREQSLFSWATSSGEAPRLLATAADLELAVAPSGSSFVFEQRGPDGRPRRELRALDGKPIASLPPPPEK